MLKTLAAGLAAAFLAAAPVLAQDDPDACYTSTDPRCDGAACANTFYNQDVSRNWQRTRASADQQLMAQIAGVYYAQNTSADGSMIQQIYYSYEPGGLFQYQDQTCASAGGIPCSQNQGAGMWAGVPQGNGTAFLMVHFSDLNRSNACFSLTVQFDGTQLVEVNTGTRLVRTR